MRASAIVAAAALGALLAATSTVALADRETGLSVSPETIEVGIDFSGADVSIGGTAPEGAEVIVKVDGPRDTIKMKKKGKVMGLLWMTVDQANVEDVPAFHVVQSSQQVDQLLSREDLVRLGLDPADASLVSEAKVVSTGDGSPLSEDKASEFASALSDVYVKDGRRDPCGSYESNVAQVSSGQVEATSSGTDGGIVLLGGGRWATCVSLRSDTPLGDSTVQAYYVKDGQVVGSEAATVSVKKVGVVDSLGSMAENKAPLYGAMSLAIVIVMGLVIGFVLPRGGSH